MPVKMKPTNAIKIDLGLEANGRVQKFFTKTCAKHIDKYVPMQTGNLADYRIVDDLIIYNQQYARYQYYGVREDGSHKIVNRTLIYHPLASSYWDRKMVSAELDDVIKETQAYLGGK